MDRTPSAQDERHGSRPELKAIQAWMYAAITHPEGVRAGAGSYLALNADPAAEHRDINAVICPSSKLSSEQRLAIYGNAYYARLIECLTEEFRASAQLLGTDTFGAFAVAYLQSYPSRSYTLNDLGRDFPRFLAESRLDDQPEDEPQRFEGWCEFLTELANLERIYSEIFSGPGCETNTTLQPEDVEAFTPDQILQATLVPVPCLRLVCLRYPAHEYISATRSGTLPPVPAPLETYLAVTRRDYIVRRASLSPEEYALLHRLVEGASIETALEDVATTFAIDVEELATFVPIWFERWTAAQYFQRLQRTGVK